MRMEVENKQEETTQKLQLCARLGGWLLRLISSKMTTAASVGVWCLAKPSPNGL